MSGAGAVCAIEGCGRQIAHRGWCHAHYGRWRRYGSPLAGGQLLAERGTPEHFFRHVVLPYKGDECLAWPFSSTRGRGMLRLDGKMWIVARLVCAEIHGPPPAPDSHAAHSCGRGHEGCVSPKHLSWKSPAANLADKYLHGTAARKLTEASVREIRSLAGRQTHRELAARYGVSRTTVGGILSSKRWTHLDEAGP